MVIEGVPVQFLPATTELDAEAMEQAEPKRYANTSAPVMRPEHLLAIALQTGRDKDYERVARLLEQVEDLDVRLVKDLISRHKLTARLAIFQRRYEDAARLLAP
ncbi:hypothetical protein D3C83_44720 [compost metagenome]